MEFFSDDQAARYGRLVDSPGWSLLERSFFVDEADPALVDSTDGQHDPRCRTRRQRSEVQDSISSGPVRATCARRLSRRGPGFDRRVGLILLSLTDGEGPAMQSCHESKQR